MAGNQKAEKLNRFLVYVLSRRPDEFGLVPDSEGWVKIRELLQALSEEEGWRHVRRASLREALLVTDRPLFEMDEERIRAREWDGAFKRGPAQDPPTLLYATVRKKGYPVALERGVKPTRHPFVILAADRAMAERVGRRRDANPVVLTVNTTQAADLGVEFEYAGECLYTATHIPVGCFTGPAPPRERPEAKKPGKSEPPKEEPMWGGFTVDMDSLGQERGRGKPGPDKKGKQKKGWKEKARKERRKKGPEEF
ncbi:MAG: RNA 2'-phosphotransferase [Desulfatibacillaceae bacterium]